MQLNIKPNQSISLISNLYNLSEDKSYYKKHKIRFPAELINEKLKKVSWSLDEVLKLKDTQEFDEGQNEKIIFDYIKYLDDLNDSLLQVIKALTPYTDEQETITDVTKWINKYNKESFTKFKDATQKDNEFIRVSSNNIKHGNVRITSFSLVNHNNKKVYGFYFSDILDEDGQYGPKPQIHKPYKNTVTGFSFNHFLLRTAGVVALNFYWLNKILFDKEKSKPHNDATVYSFISKFTNIEKEFFPDEYSTKYAKIIKNKSYLTLKYEKYMRNEEFDNIKNISWTLKFNSHDGKSNEKLPYMSLVRQK